MNSFVLVIHLGVTISWIYGIEKVSKFQTKNICWLNTFLANSHFFFEIFFKSRPGFLFPNVVYLSVLLIIVLPLLLFGIWVVCYMINAGHISFIHIFNDLFFNCLGAGWDYFENYCHVRK